MRSRQIDILVKFVIWFQFDINNIIISCITGYVGTTPFNYKSFVKK